MNLTAFHALVTDTAKRGNTLAAHIPIFTRQAVKWVERNYTFQYMRKYAAFTVDPLSANPRAISLPSSRVKELDFIRFTLADGRYYYPRKVEAQEVEEVIEGTPSRFWLDGVDFIWWDNTPTEELSAEIKYSQYTDWAAVTGSDEPWILAHGEDVILAQTMLFLSPFIRDPTLMTLFKSLRDEGLRTLILADENFAQGPARSEKISYGVVD